MINLARHFNQNKLFFFLFFSTVFFNCGKEPEKTDFAARVNNAYLTNEELALMIDTSENKNRIYKDEIIRNWIHKELLYQQAVENGIVNEENYKRILDNSAKELASAIWLKRYFDSEEISFGETEISEYYGKHKNDFKLNEAGYLLNIASFSNEDNAVDFRSAAIEKDWETAYDLFENDSSLIKYSENLFLYESKISPVNLLKIVKELQPEEISIVVNENNRKYHLVQILDKMERGTIPPFELIKPEVEKKLLFKKKESLIEEYIKELYSDNDIEVKSGTK